MAPPCGGNGSREGRTFSLDAAQDFYCYTDTELYDQSTPWFNFKDIGVVQFLATLRVLDDQSKGSTNYLGGCQLGEC